MQYSCVPNASGWAAEWRLQGINDSDPTNTSAADKAEEAEAKRLADEAEEKRLADEAAAADGEEIVLENPSMNNPFHASSYTADWALTANYDKTAHTKKGIGMWWKASFAGGAKLVESVQIKNRVDCCGERLTQTMILIDG